MTRIYAITVENAETGDREEWLWNQSAATPEAALAASDKNLRALGWPSAWRSVVALLVYGEERKRRQTRHVR